MGDDSSLGEHVDCYCVAPVHIGRNVTISQYSYLCAATHDYEAARFPLTARPIVIEDDAWVGADVFVGPGAVIAEGAVVGARSGVFSRVDPWVVAVGSPAKPIKRRHVS